MTALRWAAVAAILFAVLLVVGVLLAGDNPDGSDPDSEWVKYYSDSSNQTQMIVAVYVEAVAALGLIAFATIVFTGSELLPRLARASAYLSAAAIAIGRVALSAVGAEAKIDSSPVDPGSARFMTGLGFGTILIVGALAAAAMIAAISAHWMRTKAMPTWVPWLGYVCAVVLLFAILFLPMAALPIWAIAVGIVLLTRGAATQPAVVPAT